jgi:hypothetical protein
MDIDSVLEMQFDIPHHISLCDIIRPFPCEFQDVETNNWFLSRDVGNRWVGQFSGAISAYKLPFGREGKWARGTGLP